MVAIKLEVVQFVHCLIDIKTYLKLLPALMPALMPAVIEQHSRFHVCESRQPNPATPVSEMFLRCGLSFHAIKGIYNPAQKAREDDGTTRSFCTIASVVA
jgi:hypothetical protein